MVVHNHDVLQATQAWVNKAVPDQEKEHVKPRAATTQHGKGLVQTRGSFWKSLFGLGRGANTTTKDQHAQNNSPVMVKKGLRWVTPAEANGGNLGTISSTYASISRPSTPPADMDSLTWQFSGKAKAVYTFCADTVSAHL
ncbi:hypothetical protein WJX73_001705 [Symbiochloris irregularis]|uniref:Uncharacterized protein n=1 Tax=Symbiochloris irregularis TaxID=706552 RepID=A0AAW1PEM8_9CHLO